MHTVTHQLTMTGTVFALSYTYMLKQTYSSVLRWINTYASYRSLVSSVYDSGYSVPSYKIVTEYFQSTNTTN
jgi:hypothetical protein